MVVGGHLAQGKRVKFLAARLAQGKTLTLMDRRPAAQVRQREGGLPVTAVSGAEKGEQRLVLVDRQKLPVAERPTLGREIPRNNFDFTHKWCAHRTPPSFLADYLKACIMRIYTNKST